MNARSLLISAASAVLLLFHTGVTVSLAQTAVAIGDEAAAAEQAPEPLSAEEMEILVARVALYPDELIAVITAASLYPVQIIEAQRFLDDSKVNKTLQPKTTWDGSVVSLLNYPEIVKMMSDDLDWTQLLGEAIINQQQDVLAAIQQLRERAVAEGIIKTDDKVQVVEENDNIIIQPASAEVIYIPQYPPEMLYEPDYIYRPIAYYPDPYPYYYSPIAPFFAGAVTGAIWAGVVDWDDGFWGGNWGNDWGNDIDIDCNNCIIGGDFNGKLDINNVDWNNVDRNKINFNKSELNKIDKSKVKSNIKDNDRNKITNKGGDLKSSTSTSLPGKGNKPVTDVRTSTLDGLKKQPDAKPAVKPSAKPGQGVASKPTSKPSKPSSGSIDRPVGKPKPAVKPDNRPKTPSPVGEVKRGVDTKKESGRGAKSMGGGSGKSPSGGGQSAKKRPVPKGGSSGGGGRGRR